MELQYMPASLNEYSINLMGQYKYTVDENGLFHSYDDKPAIDYFNGNKIWMKNGILHRDIFMGPAIMLDKHKNEYYINGKIVDDTVVNRYKNMYSKLLFYNNTDNKLYSNIQISKHNNYSGTSNIYTSYSLINVDEDKDTNGNNDIYNIKIKTDTLSVHKNDMQFLSLYRARSQVKMPEIWLGGNDVYNEKSQPNATIFGLLECGHHIYESYMSHNLFEGQWYGRIANRGFCYVTNGYHQDTSQDTTYKSVNGKPKSNSDGKLVVYCAKCNDCIPLAKPCAEYNNLIDHVVSPQTSTVITINTKYPSIHELTCGHKLKDEPVVYCEICYSPVTLAKLYAEYPLTYKLTCGHKLKDEVVVYCETCNVPVPLSTQCAEHDNLKQCVEYPSIHKMTCGHKIYEAWLMSTYDTICCYDKDSGYIYCGKCKTMVPPGNLDMDKTYNTIIKTTNDSIDACYGIDTVYKNVYIKMSLIYDMDKHISGEYSMLEQNGNKYYYGDYLKCGHIVGDCIINSGIQYVGKSNIIFTLHKSIAKNNSSQIIEDLTDKMKYSPDLKSAYIYCPHCEDLQEIAILSISS